MQKNLYTILFKKNIIKNDQRPKFLFFLIKKTKHQTYKKFFRFKNTKHMKNFIVRKETKESLYLQELY